MLQYDHEWYALGSKVKHNYLFVCISIWSGLNAWSQILICRLCLEHRDPAEIARRLLLLLHLEKTCQVVTRGLFQPVGELPVLFKDIMTKLEMLSCLRGIGIGACTWSNIISQSQSKHVIIQGIKIIIIIKPKQDHITNACTLWMHDLPLLTLQ